MTHLPRVITAAVLVAFGHTAYTQTNTDLVTVHCQILDAATGRPTPARIHFSTSDGTYYAPVGHSANFSLREKNGRFREEAGDLALSNRIRYAYVDGSFDIVLPTGKVFVRVTKGFEYGTLEETLTITPDSRTKEFSLSRWYSFTDDHWYSGDTHIHFSAPEKLVQQMEAEDLDIANLLIFDGSNDHHQFRGKLDPASTKDRLLYVGQEYRDNELGHLVLLNLRKLVEPTRPMQPYNYPLIGRAADITREQGGLVGWAHFGARPGLEVPVGVALGKIDALEVLCNYDPFRAPIDMWQTIPQVSENSGLRLWYRFLNCGFRLPAIASTDRMGNYFSIGANRTYAYLPGGLSYDGWIEALRRGETFITNSPLLLLTVNGHRPGATLRQTATAKTPVSIEVEVASQVPVDELEIIANGEVIASLHLNGRSRAKLTTSYIPPASCWLAARAYANSIADEIAGTNFKRSTSVASHITPLNMRFGTGKPEVTFAHTNPVYLMMDNRPIRSAEDARYYTRYVDRAMDWLRTHGRFHSADDREAALATFRRARDEFVRRASGN